MLMIGNKIAAYKINMEHKFLGRPPPFLFLLEERRSGDRGRVKGGTVELAPILLRGPLARIDQ